MGKVPCQIGTKLPIWHLYEAFLNDSQIEAEALDILKNGSSNGRDQVQRYIDAVQGLSLQYAVMVYLAMNGYTVSRAPRGVFHYDLVVDGIKVDVKGRFTGKYWQQSKFEAEEIQKTGDEVLYFCVDYFSETQRPNALDRFVYHGSCWSNDLCTLHYNPYVTNFNECL